MLGFDKAIYLSLFLKSILSVRLNNSMWESDVLLFFELINIVFIFVLYLYWIDYIVTYFLVTSLPRYKEYMICLISFNTFSGVLPDFTYASAIGNIWGICYELIF